MLVKRCGFAAAGNMEKDLMRTYAASLWTNTFIAPQNAMPFIFHALKIIHAGSDSVRSSPILRFTHRGHWVLRISTEVWPLGIRIGLGTIAVAALAGSPSLV